MIQLIVSILVAFSILLVTEQLSRKKIIGQELSRKIPHIVGATTIAFWPLFVGMKIIALLGLVFVMAVWFVVKFNLFPNARNVNRTSWGEYFFGLGFAAAALFSPAPWIFAIAMLFVGLADTAAALVGTKYGKHKYKVFGQTKSLEGSLAFLVTALIITLSFFMFGAQSATQLSLPVIIFLPLLATFVEAISQFGIDNLAIPILAVVILSSL